MLNLAQSLSLYGFVLLSALASSFETFLQNCKTKYHKLFEFSKILLITYFKGNL